MVTKLTKVNPQDLPLARDCVLRGQFRDSGPLDASTASSVAARSVPGGDASVRVFSEAVVTGRGSHPGGAGLNENTTRLVVCIPVLVSPSCCNPIFYVSVDLLSVRPHSTQPIRPRVIRSGADEVAAAAAAARPCWCEPRTRRFYRDSAQPFILGSSLVPGFTAGSPSVSVYAQ